MRLFVVRIAAFLMMASVPLVSSDVWMATGYCAEKAEIEVSEGTVLAWDHWDKRHLPQDLTKPDLIKPVVLVVPGMMNADDSMSIFKQKFSDQQIPAALFRYDSVLGVETVAKRLYEVLSSEATQNPNRKIILLTHSMGGVVCRRVVEDPAFKLTCVSHLIMVAPPNAGSSVATLEGEKIKELSKQVKNEEIATILGQHVPAVLKETLGLYTGQARIDLAPDSELLRKVNGFSRNPTIQYTVIAGTSAPIPAAVFGIGGLAFEAFGLGNGRIGANLKSALQAFKRDEWIEGKGDGAVTVQSVELPGVEDRVRIAFSHCDTCRNPELEGNRELIECVMQRLTLK